MLNKGRSRQGLLLCGAAAIALSTAGMAQAAEAANFNIPAQPLSTALAQFGVQSEQGVFVDSSLIARKFTNGVSGDKAADVALAELLTGTGLAWRREGETFVITKAAPDPQSASAAGDGAEVEALIVTAQKREEDIQDVPIAISAFTQEDLTRSQIAGGPDLMTQIPNMTFTKTNFSSYSVQIRGIGTQAISATVDPAVAVAFNNTPFIRNRFFEQEFYDLQRVEVLRGPQGTLYGRNATAGVINMLSARPSHHFEAKLSGDLANYNSSRLEGMLNLPLVEDKVALRLAGAWTKREGFATNQTTGEQIDGRDLWSTRLTLAFEPSDAISAYLTWEHFEEDDDRLRSGKQLCKKDETPTHFGDIPAADEGGQGGAFGWKSFYGQGCEAASLYSRDSFQTPNGRTLPFYAPTYNLGNPVFPMLDPYVSATQSRDLRVIESTIEPKYKAKADLAHLQINVDVTPSLTITSETAYSVDYTWSTQDFNRFTTRGGAFEVSDDAISRGLLDERGAFCDPQLGCSDTLLLADLATAESRQFSDEIRLSSQFEGRLNFSAGANFLRYDTEDKYYVFVNTLSMFAGLWGTDANHPYVAGVSDNADKCLNNRVPADPNVLHGITCVYIDPNPIENLNDEGHNYFLSRNPYRLISYALFGELYYQFARTLKITGGLRYTIDKKHAPRIPSQLLVQQSAGHPVSEVVDQEWREPTGRLTIDWKPELAFTDETLVYASYAHGYKAGGANPPPPVVAAYGDFYGAADIVVADQNTHPKTFEAEFVDAFEIGAKNTLLDGSVTLNGNLFYYDYQGYQISQIVNRSAINLNFDAEVWGAEIELDWRPLENLRLAFKGGYEDTRLADGARAIDLIDRTAGDPNYVVIKNFPTLPSNCIVPYDFVAPSGGGIVGWLTCELLFIEGDDLGGRLDPATVPNNGEGIFKDLSGNELPNAPHFTGTLTADYTLPLLNEWLMTLHSDLYYQSEAWTRVFNMEGYDKLKAYTNVNLAAIFSNEDTGWQVMAYVKNVFDRDSITGAFLNSDDTGLTTNVFLTEPRLYGLRVTKRWSGDWTWGGASTGGPFPLTVEVGGAVTRFDAPNEPVAPAFIDSFASPELRFPVETQEEDLDWGDGRELRVTWAPAGAPWSASAGYRHAETNGRATVLIGKQASGGIKFPQSIVDAYPFLETYQSYVPGGMNYVRDDVRDREEHTLIDFSVGRDVGVGSLVDSSVSLGVRYAQFKSMTRLDLGGVNGMPDLEDGVIKYQYYTEFHQYSGTASADREFTGAGPVLSWDASKALFGDDETGRVGLDFGVTASALFGEQEVSAAYEVTDTLKLRRNIGGSQSVISTELAGEGDRTESRSTTVYSLGANLGLSYEVGRMKVSGGYRIDRFYDVLDGGVSESRDADRTLDGPYFRLAVGFGG